MRLVEGPDRERFLSLPWPLYAQDPYWVPPLKNELRTLLAPDGPFFEHAQGQLWIVEHQGKDLGRLGAFLDRSLATLGFFECVDDPAISGMLFAAAEDWLRARGAQRALGPLSPTLQETVGVLLEGEPGSPTLMMAYNPPYYPRLFEAAGYSRGRDFLAYWLAPGAAPGELPEAYRVRGLERPRLVCEVKRFTALHNLCYSHAGHYAFQAITEREAEQLAAALGALLDPRLVLLVEREGELVAALAALPDANPALRHFNGELSVSGMLRFWWARRKLEAIRIMDVLVAPAHQGRGLGTRLVERILAEAARRGCARVEYSGVVEDNEPSHRLARRFGGRVARRYRVYEKALA